MALTAGEVINHARDLHPELSPTNAPAELGYRALSRIQRELYNEVVCRQPAFLAQRVMVALPLPSFTAGIDLGTLLPNGWLDILEGYVHFTDQVTGRQSRCTYVPWEQRDMRQRFPAFMLAANTITLVGEASDWDQVDQFWLTYTALPADLVDDTSPLAFPADAREALATLLASFYCDRLISDPQYAIDAPLAALVTQKAEVQRARWLNRIWNLGTRQSYRVRDVR